MPLIFIFLLLPVNLAFTQVLDNFSDGDFTNNPTWEGMQNYFRVDPSNGALQLQAPREAGVASIFTRSGAMEDATWEFRARMGFNPSASNFAKIYLSADTNDVNLISRAYYFVLGTTDDNVSLWHYNHGIHTQLVQGVARRLDLPVVDIRVRVTRQVGGLVIVETNIGDGWIEEGRHLSAPGHESSWFGFSCNYTSTRNSHFWFDDIEVTGHPFRDSLAVEITGFSVFNRRGFMMNFSKPVSALNLEPANFILQPGALLPVIAVNAIASNSVLLQFKTDIPLTPGSYLGVSGVSDRHGNQLPDTIISYNYTPPAISSFKMTSARDATICFTHPLENNHLDAGSFSVPVSGPAINRVVNSGKSCFIINFEDDIPEGAIFPVQVSDTRAANGDIIPGMVGNLFYYNLKRNDIVITEIMHDPSPLVGLPDSEYIELYNRGKFPVDVVNFTIQGGSRLATLGSYLLYPGDYLLLIPSGTNGNWTQVKNRLALTSWPILPNSEGVLVLRDSKNRVIASARYDNNLMQAGFKRDGGWSLEIIDPDNLSGEKANWEFSVSPAGGTPGLENSVKGRLPDLLAPSLIGNYLLNDSCLVLEFSEPMDFSYPLKNESIIITPDNLAVSHTLTEEVRQSSLRVCFERQIPSNIPYEIGFNPLPRDFAGNPLSQSHLSRFAKPVNPSVGDVVINELLFDPPPGGSDFVELYNRSENIVDLSRLYISRGNNEAIPEQLIALSTETRPFFPGEHLVFTANRDWLVSFYNLSPSVTAHEIAQFPNFVQQGGTVFITNSSGVEFDRLNYLPELHFPLLGSTQGVALERVDASAPSNDTFNWHSASGNFNFATPGQPNSQARPRPGDRKEAFSLEPEVFTPDQDGVDDQLLIHYNFSEPGYSNTIKIFDRGGNLVRVLVNNTLAGTNGFYAWNGLDDDGTRVNTGIYVVLIQYFNPRGHVNEVKKVAVLGRNNY